MDCDIAIDTNSSVNNTQVALSTKDVGNPGKTHLYMSIAMTANTTSIRPDADPIDVLDAE